MPRLSNSYYEVMDELQAYMEEHSLTRSQMRQLFNIFDRALKVGYIDGIGDLSEALASKDNIQRLEHGVKNGTLLKAGPLAVEELKPIDKVEPGEIT